MEGTNRRHACTSTIILQVNIRLEKKEQEALEGGSQLFEQTYQLIVPTHCSECVTRIFHAYAVKKLPNMHKHYAAYPF